MKFKITSAILTLYTLIGLGVTILTNFENYISVVICIIFYVFIPALGAFGIWMKNRGLIFISILFFISLSIRNVGNDSIIPHIAPITVSFPFGDFANGEGYLIDYFAIFMAIFLTWLLRGLLASNQNVRRND